jgi:hypothetical protein
MDHFLSLVSANIFVPPSQLVTAHLFASGGSRYSEKAGPVSMQKLDPGNAAHGIQVDGFPAMVRLTIKNPASRTLRYSA